MWTCLRHLSGPGRLVWAAWAVVALSGAGAAGRQVAGAAGRQVAPVAAVASDVIDRGQLLRDLQALSADDMQGRRFGTPGGDRARAYVMARFRSSGILPFGQDYARPFVASGGRRGANVVGRIDGSRRPGRHIVVSAHFDHVGVRDGAVFNGANDNASGTAALFAVGRHFRDRAPLNSLIVAAFDGEEAGLLGSRAFVEAPPVDRATIALNVNADMIGRDAADTLFVAGAFRQPFLRPYIERVAARAPVRLLMGHDGAPGRGEDDWTRDSDQFAFIEARIPALYVGVEDTRYHHRPDDDYETMMPDFYIGAVETLVALIEELDANLDAIERRRTP